VATTLKQLQIQKQKLAPRQLLQARLLQLNTVNLEQTILKELEQNPVLEQIETDTHTEDEKVETPINEIDVSPEDMYSDETTYYFQQEKKEMPLPDRHTLLEDVIEQLRDTDLDDIEQEIAEEILWNTNERGYLDTELILIADRLEMDEEDLEPILHVVQRLKPKGFASRNLEECLMIQLEDEVGSMAYKIVNKYFDDFMHKRYDKIQSKLKCDEDILHEAVAHITHLNPRPGEGYTDKFQTVIPDVIVKDEGNNWVITTNDAGLPELRINREYEQSIQNEHYNLKAKKFIKEKLDSAHWFIEAVKQRRVTMVNVMHAIIGFQPEWFSGEMNFLRPLKLQDVADQIHMDISTISRSTRGKFVDTPYGIFELKYFFTDGIELNDGQILGTFVIKQALKKIINTEDKHQPLSDDALVGKLRDEGYGLARRTVAKYRDQLGFPVARLRKEI
tara:strand:+ start:26348 stop:27691 length:1344 start_codon:yes stop_codon:yes gene_type:complete